ncbi:hypothetical protein [Marinobacter salarius]|uniref:hypothetical protein n=2 Tax=Marinobacter TaxID=2742 RepID=UPI000F894A67|nr:hypothetical protein [Marinobacter salarius]
MQALSVKGRIMDVWLRIERPVDTEADIPLQDEASEKVKRKYASEPSGAFIVWSDSSDGTLGCIKNNRSISAPISEVTELVLKEMQPAKGRGFVALSFVSNVGRELAGIYSNTCSANAVRWLSEVQPLIAKALKLGQRKEDLGYDT